MTEEKFKKILENIKKNYQEYGCVEISAETMDLTYPQWEDLGKEIQETKSTDVSVPNSKIGLLQQHYFDGFVLKFIPHLTHCESFSLFNNSLDELSYSNFIAMGDACEKLENIKELNVYDNNISKMQDSTMEGFGYFLSKFKNLSSLILSPNNFDDIEDAKLSLLGKILGNLSNLTRISIGIHDFNNEARVFTAFIAKLEKLTELEIEFYEAINPNPHLTAGTYCNNMLDAINGNKTLTSLVLKELEFHSYWFHIDSFFPFLKRITKIDLSTSNFTESELKQLFNTLNRENNLTMEVCTGNERKDALFKQRIYGTLLPIVSTANLMQHWYEKNSLSEDVFFEKILPFLTNDEETLANLRKFFHQNEQERAKLKIYINMNFMLNQPCLTFSIMENLVNKNASSISDIRHMPLNSTACVEFLNGAVKQFYFQQKGFRFFPVKNSSLEMGKAIESIKKLLENNSEELSSTEKLKKIKDVFESIKRDEESISIGAKEEQPKKKQKIPDINKNDKDLKKFFQAASSLIRYVLEYESHQQKNIAQLPDHKSEKR